MLQVTTWPLVRWSEFPELLSSGVIDVPQSFCFKLYLAASMTIEKRHYKNIFSVQSHGMPVFYSSWNPLQLRPFKLISQKKWIPKVNLLNIGQLLTSIWYLMNSPSSIQSILLRTQKKRVNTACMQEVVLWERKMQWWSGCASQGCWYWKWFSRITQLGQHLVCPSKHPWQWFSITRPGQEGFQCREFLWPQDPIFKEFHMAERE